MIDAAGCRGLTVGDAKVSEMHCNFLINEGNATGADLETLGETVRARVKETSGVELEWEIKRLGIPAYSVTSSMTRHYPRKRVIQEPLPVITGSPGQAGR